MRPRTAQIPNTGQQLRFVGPGVEPRAGVAAVRIAFPEVFGLVARVGPEAALLLLMLRAMRTREPEGAVQVEELAWMLVARPGEILGWLERLSLARLLVYDRRVKGELVVELVARLPDPATWPLEGTVGPPREIPTYYFTQVLPRARPTAFLLYLALLAREEGPGAPARCTEDDLRRTVGARSIKRVRFELWRLRRLGLLRRSRSGRRVIVLDPPPLSGWNRRYLQLLRWGYRPLPWARMAIASVVIALVLLILGYLVTHPRDVLLRPPLRDDERADARRMAILLPGA